MPPGEDPPKYELSPGGTARINPEDGSRRGSNQDVTIASPTNRPRPQISPTGIPPGAVTLRSKATRISNWTAPVPGNPTQTETNQRNLGRILFCSGSTASAASNSSRYP